MSEQKFKMNLDPWEQGFCWFWYNDEEIFRYTQEDFDARAKALAESGITIIMTFSVTHFRLSFYPYWEELNECLRKIVIACHKYGIRVVEHHSAHLTLQVLAKDGWMYLDRNFFTYSRGTSKYDNWKKIFPYLTYDYKINGVDFRNWVQIDGRTGQPGNNEHGTYAMCFNNPEYRKAYKEYLKGVVATGIDGIMNDDISYFTGNYNCCACEHCRKLFREETGYELPTPEGWSAFFENYENPAYVAWKQFKRRSTERYHRELQNFYLSMGLKLLRPNYCSDILKHASSCYPFDRCMDIWDFVFQENCFSAVMSQSYLDFMVEAIHRQAAGEHYGMPSMSMFYPDRPDSTYFGWALARSWGQLYTGTCEGMDVTPLERPFRMFEKKHVRYYRNPKKIADLSVYISRNTRDLTANARYAYMQKMLGGMQAAYEANLGLSLVMDDYTVEEMLEHRTLLVSYVAMASDTELEKFSEYVKRGGKMIILGDFARFDTDGSERDSARLEELLGVKLIPDTALTLGEGEIWRMSFENEELEFQPTVWSNRRVPNPQPAPAVVSKYEIRKNGTGRVLRNLIKPNFSIACENEHVVLTSYKVENAIAVHLVNLADTLAESEKLVAHTDLIPNFTADAAKLPAIRLTVNPSLSIQPKSAVLYTPESEKEFVLNVVREGDTFVIDIPEGIFSAYALIALEV